MKTPKNPKPAKFIQIVFHPFTNDLYALDQKGVIWRRDLHAYPEWRKQTDERGTKQ